LLQDLGYPLRLSAIALEALSGGAAPVLYRFGVAFMILSGFVHKVLRPLLG